MTGSMRTATLQRMIGHSMVELDYMILGRVAVRPAASPEPVRMGEQVKLVVARLLLRPGALVTTDAIAGALWGDEERASRRNGVQHAVRAARAALGDTVEPRRVLVLDGDAYRIVIPSLLLVDAERFKALATRGHDLLAEQPRTARAMLSEALHAAGGSLFGEFADRPWAAGHAAELDRLRERVEVDLNEARLALGEYADLDVPVRRQIVERPLDERLRGQLIRALLGDGRATEASMAFRDAVAELGALGPELMALGRQAARGTPDVPWTAPSHSRARRPGHTVVCVQLDAVGRAPEQPGSGTIALILDAHGGTALPIAAERMIAVFEEPGVAMRAARAIASDFRFAARIGVHVGSIIDLGDRLIGPGPAHGWQLALAAHPGQMLVSGAAQERAGSTDGLRELGEHRFPDLGPPAPLFELVHPRGLVFDPPVTLSRRPTNLPIQPTRFVGRAADVDALSRLASPGALLTLTGPGGCGKTRLALQVAARNIATFAEGAWFVGLAEIEAGSGIESVAAGIANQLGVRALPGETLPAAVVRHVADRAMLLVLDNCEQVHEACADLLAQIHVRCRDVGVIATSRRRLGIAGEVVSAILPMTIDDDDPEVLSDAVELLLERAGPPSPHDVGRADVLAEAAAICRAFDGLPLAIELAAGQVATRGLAGVAAEVAAAAATARPLSQYISVDPSRPARQRTIESAIAWSYDLLDEREQHVLPRLAVFRGTFGETEARLLAIGDGPAGEIAGDDVADILASLIESSMVVVAPPLAGTSRMRLLEPIRTFALRHLEEGDRLDAVRAAHAAIYFDLATHTAPGLFGPTEQICTERLEADHDNLRVALAWYVDRGAAESALRLVGALWWLWFSHGHLVEGCVWVERVLALDDMPSRLRVRALRAGSHLSWWRGDFAGCQAYNDELAVCAEVIDDAWGRAWGLMAFGAVEMFHDPAAALARFAQSKQQFEALSCAWEAGYALLVSGGARWFGGEDQAAGEAYDEAVEIFERLGHSSVLASARRGSGLMAARRGHVARGIAMCEQARRLSDAIADRAGSAQALNFLAAISRDTGDHATALLYYREALLLAHAVGELWATCWALDGIAGVAVAFGEPEIAARLLAHSGRLASRAGYRQSPHELTLRQDDIRRLRRQLGEDFERADAEGALMSVNAAVVYADAFAARYP